MLPLENPAKFADRLAEIGPDRIYASPFNITHGRFKGSTRSLALELASEFNWTEPRVREAMAILQARLPVMA